MSTIEDLFAKAATLPENERAELAALLIDSLEDDVPDAGVEEAWASEVDRRIADYRVGRVETVGWSELRARL